METKVNGQAVKPPSRIDPVTILEGCAYTVLQTLPSNSVDCIITSPPYWGLRDYGIPPTDWPACAYAPMPGLDKIAVPAETSCLGLEPTLHAFLAHLVLIFEQCRRVLKPTGSAWVNMGDGYANDCFGTGSNNAPCKQQTNKGTTHKLTEKERYRGFPAHLKKKDLIGQPWRVAFALQAAGWYLRQDNIWHKPNPMPESVRDRATKAHEYVFHLTKSERYFFDLEAWSEKASENTNLRISKAEAERIQEARSNGANTSTGKSGHERKTAEFDGNVKNNGSYKTAVCLPVLTRNKRSVWTVPTVAYSEAHYATYPPRLITPPLLASTSAKGCCAACGKPWERIVEKVETGLTQKAADTEPFIERDVKKDSPPFQPQAGSPPATALSPSLPISKSPRLLSWTPSAAAAPPRRSRSTTAATPSSSSAAPTTSNSSANASPPSWRPRSSISIE